jgi:phosphoribosyl-ATP pyrophosphohydrolase
MVETPENARVLERLYTVIESRRGGDPDDSYTARLLDKGPAKIAQKVGEEAVETVIAALGEDKDALAAESADLLYHLLVLWAARGLEPARVWTALAAREGVSGLAEKASRKGD